jgi:hypothetical protein
VKRISLISVLLLATATFVSAEEPAAPAAPAEPKIKPSAPIKDFRLPTFDKDGKRATFMKASEALFVTNTRIDVKEMNFTLFTKDGTGAFDTLLIAPTATFLTDKQIVSGNDSMRLLRVNIEVTGEKWSYNHIEKRVLIGKNVRVTFQDELKDIIK